MKLPCRILRDGFLVLSVLAVSPMSSSAACECGKERWSVKTGTDQDAGQVNLTTVHPTTIQAMRAWNAPDDLPGNARAAAEEKQVWAVDATLVRFKAEKDCDYHVVLSDEAARTLAVKVVAAHCVGVGSPFASQISTVRSTFEKSVSTSGSGWKIVNRPVRVTGVGFFDRLHGQTDMAANGIELPR